MISNAQRQLLVRQQPHGTCRSFAVESFVSENRIREHLMASMLADGQQTKDSVGTWVGSRENQISTGSSDIGVTDVLPVYGALSRV